MVVVAFIPRAAAAQGGDPLGPEFRVNTYTTGDQYRPAVASDASGNFVVVWESGGDQDGSSYGVFGQRYAGTGAPLGPEFRVNTHVTGFQGNSAVASDASGDFVVVWETFQDGSGEGIFGQRYDSSGAPLGTEFRVNTYTTNYQNSPDVASDSSGNFVVVWMSRIQDGPDRGIFGQRYASTGAPLGTEFRVNTHTTGPQIDPTVASDSSGNFVVVWMTSIQDGSNSGVFGQRYASTGAPLGTEFRLNTYTTGFQGGSAVASDASGNFVVVWVSDTQDGWEEGIFGQRYASNGAPLGPEFRVNTYTTNYQWFSAVALDPSGNFVVVWVSHLQDGADAGVFGQRYASTGAPLGPEFRVTAYTTSSQTVPAVASDASGNFVVVWQSFNQDGSHSGIFGQRYSMIVPVELMHFRVE